MIEIQTDYLIHTYIFHTNGLSINDDRDTNGLSNLRIVNFAVLADSRLKITESKNRDKYRDLAREQNELLNMKVTVMPILIGELGTIIKGLVKRLEDLEIRGHVETIQTRVLSRSARLPRRVLDT